MPNQTGPTTQEGKALTRYNAATHGLYSESPVLPRLESEDEWREHRAQTFQDAAPTGYLQELIVERIVLNSWRLKRLVRYEREQVRNRQRSIPDDLEINAIMDGGRVGRKLTPAQLDLIDRWLMDRLIPREKELMLLMRWEGRLTRDLRRDMLHLEHMQRERRDERRSLRPPAPESLGEVTALRQLN